ncbi:hypothetical protein FRX31_014175 [Thalictrum thalictroides]|uniref:Uncharacterized protein n=1 Tax=Thalictrum thalictroides TaxID=46969 RepID=A0A7J6WFS9_THATH|nr:hypothetical protein FRX31_014175 [Thalictrum thalictroides]
MATSSTAVDGSHPLIPTYAVLLQQKPSPPPILPLDTFRSFRKEGKLAFSFSKEDPERWQLLVSAHSVVLKFSAERSSLGIIRSGIKKSWNVTGNFTLGFLDARHALLRFEEESKVLCQDKIVSS